MGMGISFCLSVVFREEALRGTCYACFDLTLGLSLQMVDATWVLHWWLPCY